MQKYLGFVILLILLWAVPALAVDPYVVTGVQVDVTAATAPKARDEAIRQASRKAFEILSGQIFPGKPVPKVSNQALGNMVSDFHVEQEQVAANRYVATFTFRFRQIPVRTAFGARMIPSPQELTARLGQPAGAVADAVEGDTNITQVISSESGSPLDTVNQESGVAEPVSITPIPGNAILVQVTAHNSRELDQAMARFRDVDSVREIEYVSITPEKSILRLSYAGEPDHLLSQMQTHGVSLRVDNGTVPPLYILQP